MSEQTIQITVRIDKEHRLPLPKLVWQELKTNWLNLRMVKTHADITITLTPTEAKAE